MELSKKKHFKISQKYFGYGFGDTRGAKDDGVGAIIVEPALAAVALGAGLAVNAYTEGRASHGAALNKRSGVGGGGQFKARRESGCVNGELLEALAEVGRERRKMQKKNKQQTNKNVS